MPLVDIELSINGFRFAQRCSRLSWRSFICKSAGLSVIVPSASSGFVPSGFATVYQSLRAIVEAELAPGNSFCEWGSGFGVVASLAAMLNFRSYGIEIEKDLIDASKRLTGDFALSVEFVHGSFIPPESRSYADEACAVSNAEFCLVTDADNAILQTWARSG